MTIADQQALTDALSAEYAAVYAYGVIAAYANRDRDRFVSECTAAHRVRRDATIDALKGLGATVPAPAAAYTTPFVVDDPIPAAKLAVTVEADTAAAWHSALTNAETPDVRRIALDALTESAMRQANWNAILGIAPATTAFPGQP